ncbi:unnamed protein product [Albugo candida]|uniref:Uncharacterized protein n=1 Tax=Albugo candida TaxID=65357 RepID=A0A024FTL9_9STRA|nr:unnamed protein product [Albugo candida]|eukprot:CCI10282.1 unnamed protein product [Albugo candida]
MTAHIYLKLYCQLNVKICYFRFFTLQSIGTHNVCFVLLSSGRKRYLLIECSTQFPVYIQSLRLDKSDSIKQRCKLIDCERKIVGMSELNFECFLQFLKQV